MQLKREHAHFVLPILFIATGWFGALTAYTSPGTQQTQSLLTLSGKLLYAVKTESPTDSMEKELDSLEMDAVLSGLNNDAAKKTFWINIYNAYYQILALREKKTRPGIFKEKLVPVAGHYFSLDDIEHGILRKYRWKYSLGYLPRFFAPNIIKKLAVSKMDYRIHFTLNCGAKSCPPIAFYEIEKLESQLELATKSFLRNETEIDTMAKVLRTTKIIQWYRGDFGSRKKIRSLFSKIFRRDFSNYSIKYKEYLWDARLRNYESL